MWAYWIFMLLESFFINLFLPEGALALEDSIYVILIIVDAVVLLFMLGSRYAHDTNFAILITCGVLFRLALLFWSEYYSHIFTLPNSGADEFTYYYNAMSNLVKDKSFTGYASFYAWQARIYGLSKVFGKYINLLFSISAITILRKILIRLRISRNVQTITLAFACLLPNYAILSSLLLRESVLVLLIAIAVYCLICWWQEGRLRYVAMSLAAALVGAWLHSGVIAYALGIFCVVLSTKRTARGHHFVFSSVRTIGLTVAATAVILFVLLRVETGLTIYFRGADSLADIVSIADAYEDGGSAYNANIVSNESVLGFIINTPVRMLFFLLAPMPWDWRSGTDAIAFIMSGLFYGYVFFTALPYMRRYRERPILSVLFLIALLTLIVFSWGVSNSGTALRHRDKMVIHYLLIFAIMQDEKIKQRRGLRREYQ